MSYDVHAENGLDIFQGQNSCWIWGVHVPDLWHFTVQNGFQLITLCPLHARIIDFDEWRGRIVVGHIIVCIHERQFVFNIGGRADDVS